MLVIRFIVHIAVDLSVEANIGHHSASLSPCILPFDRLIK